MSVGSRGGGGFFIDEQPALRGVLVALRFDHRLGFVHQLFQGFELFVDAGKSHVSDLINPPQPLGDELADRRGRNFAIVGFEDFFLHFVREALQLALRDRGA